MALKATGTLPIGVEVDGVLHREFVVRGSTVNDNIEVTDELLDSGESPTALRTSTALMARQLEQLGTLPKEQITTALVRGMHTADWNHLDAESDALQKKLKSGDAMSAPDGGSHASSGVSAEASTPST